MDEDGSRSFINRFLIYASKLFKGKEKQEQVQAYSKFRKLVDSLDEEAHDYTVADLCEEALRVVKQRLSLIGKIQELEEKLAEIECFDKLNSEEAAQLRDLLDRFVALTKERNALRYQLTDFDKSVTYMENMEEDADNAMPHIQDAEKSQRILRHDLSHLKGEKSELEYERELLEKGIVFINKFTYVMVGIFCAITIYLGYTNMFQGNSIFFAITVLILLAIILISLLYFFRRRMRYELIMNIKKQQKAVNLLNKKSAVYAHYSNFLRYEYKKYKVRNSQMLKSTLNDYNNYKYTAARVDSVREIMYETENQIEQFLREKKINHVRGSVEQFAKTIDIDDKKKYYQELSRERDSLERNLRELDSRHEVIWDSLVTLNEKDTSEEKLANHVIQVYIDEVSRLVSPANPPV